MPVLQVAVLIAMLSLFGVVCWWAGVRQGHSDEHFGCERAIKKARTDADARVTAADEHRRNAEEYARECEHENVFLRMQVRGLTHQLQDGGLAPWTSEHDTPPPVSRRGLRTLG